MIVIAGLVLGAALGALQARRRGGKPLDMAHHAAVYGIAGALAGMLATIVLARVA
jgi:F0F1-type ATP synthase assembly protein I